MDAQGDRAPVTLPREGRPQVVATPPTQRELHAGTGAARLFERSWALIEPLTSARRFTIGASLTRVGLGLVTLSYYLIHYGDRHFLFGPDGVWPWSNFHETLRESGSFSLYALSRADLWFELLFHAGIVVSLLVVVGFRTRAAVVVHYVLTWSIYQRNPTLLDGGDNLLYLVVLYLVAVDCGAHFSIDAARRRRRGVDDGLRGLRYRVGSLLHHAGVAAIAVQVCVLYLTSGLYKVQGQKWQDGTALYYILRVPEFTWPGWSERVYMNAFLVTVLTYATVLFQLSFPFLLLNRYTRLAAVAGGLFFHVGIALFMGLAAFSATMISVELLLLSDQDYGRLRRWARALRSTPAHVGRAPPVSPGRRPVMERVGTGVD